jgi:hypothetical protein
MITGVRFTKWGLGLFIFGVFLSFGVIAHYCVGSRWNNGALFMQNITLWWACPWTLSVAAVQAGALGMVAIGLARMLAARMVPHDAAESATPLRLCVVGLLGVFAVGYPGYFVFDAIWPSFYYSPIAVGKKCLAAGASPVHCRVPRGHRRQRGPRADQSTGTIHGPCVYARSRRSCALGWRSRAIGQ